MITNYAEYTLKTLLVEKKWELSLTTIKSYIYQTLVGIEYLHSKKIFHGNLKFDNILLFKGGIIKLADYGHYGFFTRKYNKNNLLFTAPEIFSSDFHVQNIVAGKIQSNVNAKAIIPNNINGEEESSTHDNKNNNESSEPTEVKATKVYMFDIPLKTNYQNKHKKSAYFEKIDEWSVGVMLYVLLCKKYPFEGTNKEELLNNIHSSINYLYKKEFVALTRDQKDIIQKLLNPNPKSRISAHDALSHRFFANKNEYYLTEEDTFSLKKKSIKYHISLFCLFICIYYYERENETTIEEIYRQYVLRKNLSDVNKELLLKFMKELNIVYDNRNADNIINFMLTNKVFQIKSTCINIYLYFSKKLGYEEFSFKDIYDYVLKILPEIERNELGMSDEMFNQLIPSYEFKEILFDEKLLG